MAPLDARRTAIKRGRFALPALSTLVGQPKDDVPTLGGQNSHLEDRQSAQTRA